MSKKPIDFDARVTAIVQVDPKQLPPVPPMPLNPAEVKEDSVTGVTNVSPKKAAAKKSAKASAKKRTGKKP